MTAAATMRPPGCGRRSSGGGLSLLLLLGHPES